jgi:hypothetical protein
VIAEEDECPVCGNELPPRGPDGEEAARERHVEDCINGHFVSDSPSGAAASTAITSPVDSFPVGVSASSAPPMTGPWMLDDSGRPRASSSADQPIRRRATGNRMLKYVATEKDCIGDDGEASECIICLEEFETGQNMARLNCWCKFHEVSAGAPLVILIAN